VEAARPIRVLIADDDANVRETLARLIGGEATLEVVGTAGDADQAIGLASATHPDVALVDVQMPGGGGQRATLEIKKVSPATRVVALSAHGERTFVLGMLRAGATSYLIKGARVEEILETLRVAAGGAAVLSGEITRDVVDELASHLHREELAAEHRRETSGRIRRVLSENRLVIATQPIMALETRTTVGVEALSRFPDDRSKPPNIWFSDAWSVGLGVELELAAIRAALSHADAMPQDSFLSVNVSPQTVESPQFGESLAGFPLDRLMIEITEHAKVEDYEALERALDEPRAKGVRVAIDDAGAGFASLRHILRLRPDVIKLDVDLAHGIHQDATRRALASALIAFAGEIDRTIIAEGIETGEELGALVALGVRLGQGYYLGRPEELP
jgi:EAL domain-containing protein (putative c-di-GMP-specific phosphodiesterase class I)/CheY-like chemotaxis protein